MREYTAFTAHRRRLPPFPPPHSSPYALLNFLYLFFLFFALFFTQENSIHRWPTYWFWLIYLYFLSCTRITCAYHTLLFLLCIVPFYFRNRNWIIGLDLIGAQTTVRRTFDNGCNRDDGTEAYHVREKSKKEKQQSLTPATRVPFTFLVLVDVVVVVVRSLFVCTRVHKRLCTHELCDAIELFLCYTWTWYSKHMCV